MIRSALSKVAWVGRTTSMVFGLALVMALILGVASMALGANGDFFKVGKANIASAVSVLTKRGAGPALSLKVDRGAPLAVNSDTKVAKLNADKLDGKNATQIGVNGLERVHSISPSDSSSPKIAQVFCPEGKVLVGTGYDLNGGTSGFPPNELTEVVIDRLEPSLSSVFVLANETDSTSANWSVTAYAMCAKAP
jgi:hypothetical protein